MPPANRSTLDRRQLLHAGALGAFGLTLPQLLRAESAARPGKIKSCIIVFAFGGPAQQETFDMKPDAPEEVRGEFKPIATNVTGTRISEYLPKLAMMADKYSIIRSVTHKNRIHNPGSYYMLTGRKPGRDVVEFPARRSDWPSVGSVMGKLRPVQQAVPPYVVLPVFANDINIPTPGQHAGFLGAVHDPMVLNGDPNTRAYGVPALAPRPELTLNRMDDRRQLLATIDRQAEALNKIPSAGGLDSHYARAFDLVSSGAAKKAFDLEQESAATRDRYGRNRHGQSVLLARRLVEAGVRLVLVNDAEENGQNKVWDTHGGGFKTLRKHLPETDGAMSSLLHDLQDRGMLDSTLVVWMGEFGRSPKVDKAGGRDHWPDVYSMVMAGGGIRGGTVYGASDSQAAQPKEKPVSPEEVHATMYKALGIDEDTHVHDNLGRPMALFAGKPIRELF
ncbi:MAG: DUF1501 domain-containing protein [Planctomycetaceae bacterium]|nr:DUF1501 domain-containing protein [Planctomycetaceae bacterium]